MKEDIEVVKSKRQIRVNSIRDIALYLEGIKQGRGGDILPLGTHHLEELWGAMIMNAFNQMYK